MSDIPEDIRAAALPWGVNRLRNIYPGGAWSQKGICVSEPYTGNRLVAAWWVLTGRAHALVWPEDGELEQVYREACPNSSRGLA